MMHANSDVLSLIDIFKEFYKKLLNCGNQVQRQFPVHETTGGDFPPNGLLNQEALANHASAVMVTHPGAVPTILPQIVPYSLEAANFLRDQETRILTTYGNFSGESFKEAQYAMAAFADEFFLTLPWQGKSAWDQCLVEMNLFNSHVAGELFFDRLDAYLLKGSSVSGQPLGFIYYYILSLGFKGKYKGLPTAEAVTDDYKQRLFLHLLHHRPQLSNVDVLLYPQTYNHTITDGLDHKILSPKWWWGLCAVMGCVFVMVSHVLWRQATGPTFELIDKIVAEGLINERGN